MTTAKAKMLTIEVNKTAADKAKFRGARAAWLEHLRAYDGMSLALCVKAAQEEPPSTPKTGKYANVCEPPMGWVRFFVRQQIVEVVNK